MKTAPKKQTYVRIPRTEYLRLKRAEKAVSYQEYLKSIERGREDILAGRTIPQEDLFKELGF